MTPRLAICLLAGIAALFAGEPRRAEKLILEGHWKRARAIVEPRYREAPDDPLVNFLLSQIRNAFGDRESPPKLAERAVALAPGVGKFHRQMAEVAGVMAQQSNMFRQLMLARRFQHEIDRALILDPNDLQALRDRMEFYLLAPGVAGGDPQKARATTIRIASLDACEGFLAEARLAAFHKETASIEGLLRKAVAADPASFRARESLAAYYLAPEHLNLDAAAAQGRDAISRDPARVLGYSISAEVLAARESWRELDALLDSAEHQVPDDFTPYYRAAVRLLATGRDLPRARRYLDKYLSQDPEGNEPTRAEAQVCLLAAAGRTR